MKFLQVALLLIISITGISAQTINGVIKDAKSNEPVIGANVIIKGTTTGTTTDFDGKFSISLPANSNFPVTLQASFIGYSSQDILVKSATEKITISLIEDQTVLGEVSVVEQRLSQKQRESALTVEALDNIAIKETPAVSFYDALGNLKGVDLTSASIGFKVINTRGFNSTSPVRSLQIINGVDNQAPGLNFSLGNFLGASELDVMNVDIIAGASTAFYGPGAFNGVISMTTKSPFDFQGLSVSVKGGERRLLETAVRYGEAFRIGKKDYDNIAFKINLYYLRADDWEATNYQPVDDSDVPASNPGGYNAINIYGDEALTGGNDYDNLAAVTDFPSYAGLGKYYRTGYREEDLVDYDTRNLKTNFGLFYRVTPKVEISYNFNYGAGTTVYQGENRFSLKDINFYQNVVEVRQKDKFFIKAYATNEDAGNSYDAVLTAFKMNEAIASNDDWNTAYRRLYRNSPLRYGDSTLALTGTYNSANFPGMTAQQWFEGPYKDSLNKYNSVISGWHQNVRNNVDNGQFTRPEAGSPEFDSLFNYITSRTFTEGGSKFYDKSALYHIMGEYQFNPTWATIKVGGNYRMYRPDSRGNIFDEVDSIIVTTDQFGNEIDREFVYRKITNDEFGMYVGAERKFLSDLLKLNLTVRMDKNENFDYLVSPALSAVYEVNAKNTIRLSLGSAIRNPTLQDQYLNYNVGPAVLKGNINGFDSLVSTESFDVYRNSLDRTQLDYFNVAPIAPEKVKTIELGYRASAFKRLFLDMSYYRSWYTDFIGYQFGIDLDFPNSSSNLFQSLQAYRVAANAQGLVVTQGFNIGGNYYLTDELTINGNYSFNEIDLTPDDNFVNRTLYGEDLPADGEVDPIVPAFNTPKSKFNLGITGRGYKPFSNKDHKFGFSVNYKWVQGFLFEGSPQFTGYIEAYGLADAQISYQIPKIYTTFKLGASNLLNNEVYQVYGGPTVGRLTYFSILFEKF